MAADGSDSLANVAAPAPTRDSPGQRSLQAWPGRRDEVGLTDNFSVNCGGWRAGEEFHNVRRGEAVAVVG